MTQQMRNEIDMLQGNINRMCVTKDEIELASMKDYAKIRIDRLFSMKQSHLRKENEPTPSANEISSSDEKKLQFNYKRLRRSCQDVNLLFTQIRRQTRKRQSR